MKPGSRLVADLGADSLDTLELAMALEDAFNLDEVASDDWDRVVSVQDAVDVIDRYLLASPNKPAALPTRPELINLLAISDEARRALIGKLAAAETRLLKGADTVRAALVDRTLYVDIEGVNVLTVTARQVNLEFTQDGR